MQLIRTCKNHKQNSVRLQTLLNCVFKKDNKACLCEGTGELNRSRYGMDCTCNPGQQISTSFLAGLVIAKPFISSLGLLICLNDNRHDLPEIRLPCLGSEHHHTPHTNRWQAVQATLTFFN